MLRSPISGTPQVFRFHEATHEPLPGHIRGARSRLRAFWRCCKTVTRQQESQSLLYIYIYIYIYICFFRCMLRCAFSLASFDGLSFRVQGFPLVCSLDICCLCYGFDGCEFRVSGVKIGEGSRILRVGLCRTAMKTTYTLPHA